MILLLMGVSGAGKTTVGERLAGELGWPFHDGDEFHPAANVEKMRRGMALTDEDRWPWLEALRDHIATLAARGESAVVACSALKASYRDFLLSASDDVRLVYLRGSPELIDGRLRARTGHFFDPALLSSQFEALEEPSDAMVVEVGRTLEEVVAEIRRRVGLQEEA